MTQHPLPDMLLRSARGCREVEQQLVSGSNSMPVNVSSLAPGIYWVDLSGEMPKGVKVL